VNAGHGAASVAAAREDLETLYADALVQLDCIEANSEEISNALLRGITRMMVVDARQILLGNVKWSQDQVDYLVRQVLSGELAASVPGIVK
jgi:hypothetical protein